MPTTLPNKPPRRLDLFLLFLFALAVSMAVIEIIDPAPMDVEAALIASP